MKAKRRPSLADMEPTLALPLNHRQYSTVMLRDHGVSLNKLRTLVYEFPRGTKVQHALEIMSNGSCGD